MNEVTYHPEASDKWAEAVTYLLEHASPALARELDGLIQGAIAEIKADCLRFSLWRETSARRYVLPRFSYVIFYQELPGHTRILAIAHTSRRPGYWTWRIAD